MKYLLVLLVVLAGAWMLLRRRDKPAPPPEKRPPATGRPAEPARGAGAQPMVACSHCGVHLPQAEAAADVAGRLYCSQAHLLAGPR